MTETHQIHLNWTCNTQDASTYPEPLDNLKFPCELTLDQEKGSGHIVMVHEGCAEASEHKAARAASKATAERIAASFLHGPSAVQVAPQRQRAPLALAACDACAAGGPERACGVRATARLCATTARGHSSPQRTQTRLAAVRALSPMTVCRRSHVFVQQRGDDGHPPIHPR